MRWQELFEDLAAQQEALERAERAVEVAEHTRAERGQVELAHRLLAHVGQPLRLHVRGVGPLTGVVREVGSDWLLLSGVGLGGSAEHERERERETVVTTAAVMAVEGLTTRADASPRRLGLRHALRALSRDRARVRVHDLNGEQRSGTIDRVLADHLDLARHADDEARRPGAVRGVVSLPYPAIALVRRL